MSVRQVRHRDTRGWNRARVGLTAKPIIAVRLKWLIKSENGTEGDNTWCSPENRVDFVATPDFNTALDTMQGSRRSPAYSGHTTPTPTFMQPTNVGQTPQKRRRTDSVPINGNGLNVGTQHPQQFIQHDTSHAPMEVQHNIAQVSPQPAHIPKRGARACTACRKGKNRCEGEVLTVGFDLAWRAIR